MEIRFLESQDYEAWLPLWQENMQHKVADKVTEETWARLCSDEFPMGGLGLWDDENTLAAILHFVLHPTTGAIEPVCYMQDVFVSPSHRRKGYARILVSALAQLGQKQKWNRIYWMASREDEAAQGLYKDIGIPVDFSLHVIPILIKDLD